MTDSYSIFTFFLWYYYAITVIFIIIFTTVTILGQENNARAIKIRGIIIPLMVIFSILILIVSILSGYSLTVIFPLLYWGFQLALLCWDLMKKYK